MPITIDLDEFRALSPRNSDRRDAEDGGALDASTVLIQFVCSTGGDGAEHDPRGKPDEHVRPEHAALHGSVWRIDDPGAPVPPLDYGCRCAIRYVAKPGTEAARALPEAPGDPVSSPAEAFRAWLDKNTPGWRDVANAMAQAPPGDELAVAYRELARLQIRGDRRALARMISQAEPAAAPVVPPASLVAPPPAPAPATATVPPRPSWLPAGRDAAEGRGLRIDGAAPASAGPAPAAPVGALQIEAAERWIGSRTTERGVIVNSRGQVASAVEGDAQSVAFTSSDIAAMRDGVVTHNHPDDGVPPDRQQYNPPSDADLLVAVIADAQAVRAVTPQGVVYQIGRPPDGWPFAGAGGGITQARAVRSRLRTALESARRHPDVAGEVARAIAAGEVSPAGSYLLLQHLALARLAKLGRISYTVGRYAT